MMDKVQETDTSNSAPSSKTFRDESGELFKMIRQSMIANKILICNDDVVLGCDAM
jgi:hypothetical protein